MTILWAALLRYCSGKCSG